MCARWPKKEIVDSPGRSGPDSSRKSGLVSLGELIASDSTTYFLNYLTHEASVKNNWHAEA